MDNPLVSIIVPVYNVEKYLQKCLDSIVKQTYNNIEIVLVDDGSKDSSGEICDKYSSSNSRIKVIHKPNEGVAIARLTGFENSTGDLVTFVDADDYIDLQYIEKLVTPFVQYDIDLSTCEETVIGNNFNNHPKRSVHGYFTKKEIEKILSTRYLLDKNLNSAGLPIYLWAKMIRRQFVEDALKCSEGLWWGEDQIATFYLLTHIRSMYCLEESLYYYVQHEGQITRDFNIGYWLCQLEYWKRYKILDTNNLLKTQLPERMWWTVKRNFRKICNQNITYQSFRNDMKIIHNNIIWKELLRNKKLPKGKRENLAFFLLRNRLYYPFYKLLLHRL